VKVTLGSSTHAKWFSKQKQFVVGLLGRAFKMVKHGIYFFVMALLVAELFKICFVQII